MTRRKYLRDSVTGRPYDPDTRQYLLEETLDENRDSISADLLSALSTPSDTALTPDHATALANLARKQRPEPPTFSYVPPAGFPADPAEWLAYLRAGSFTDAQLAYLRSGARGVYALALAQARANPALVAEVALGDAILQAWDEALRNAPPAAPFNPFGGIAQ